MKTTRFLSVLLTSIILSGCQTLGDDWAKSASESFLKMTGNTPPNNSSSATNAENSSARPARDDSANQSSSSSLAKLFNPSASASQNAPRGENSSGNTQGTITLLGPDTAMVGTSLDTGYVGTSLAAGFQPDYIVIVDRQSTVTMNEQNMLVPNNADPSNGFVLVVTDVKANQGPRAISMSIVVGGVKHDYLCSTQPSRSMVHCGENAISLDIPNRSVSFRDAKVINDDTKTILTMAGSLGW